MTDQQQERRTSCPSRYLHVKCPVCDERTQFHSKAEWCLRCGWAENRRPVPEPVRLLAALFDPSAGVVR